MRLTVSKKRKKDVLHPGVEPGLIACKATVLTATPMEPLPGTQIPSPKADRHLTFVFSLQSTNVELQRPGNGRTR